MLHLYDLDHNKIKGLKKYIDYYIESVLSTGYKTLSFSYPSHLDKDIIEECYIRNKTDEFIIKQIDDNGEWINIIAVINVESLEGKEWKSFETVESTIQDSLNLAFAGTGWSVKSSSITKKRTIRLTNTNSWEILQQAIKTYRCEIKLDSINKIVTISERLGSDKGVYFIDSLNLVSINKQSDSYDFYTRLIALGKTTVTGEDDSAIENTLEVTVENHQYSNKVKTLIWKDERYTDEASLREDATYKLDEISKPYRSYTVNILDLANMNVKYKDILSYSLGDTVTIISNNFKDKQRIVKLTEYPEEPEKNSCELGNISLTFDQIQKEEKEVASTVSNITSDNGTISENAIKDVVKKIVAGTINVDDLNAIKINVGELNATVAKINTAYIDKAYIETLIADYAKIENLEAVLAKIGTLEVDYGTIKELLAGNITSGNIQTGSITGDILNMSTVFIKDANIIDLTAGKITGGTLDTSKVTIQSENGNIIIADATQQFKDQNGKVRLQIGQDAVGNFTFVLLDETGAGVLIDSTGIKENAIGDGLIKEKMIGEGEVGGSKINWTSFVQEFNKDTNTNSILSSKIMVDGTNQSVNLHFNKLNEKTSSIEGDISNLIETTNSNTTQLNLQQGKIDTLIQDTTIEKAGESLKLKDEYSKLEQTVGSISTTVKEQASSIEGTNLLANSKSTVFNSAPKVPYKIGDLWIRKPGMLVSRDLICSNNLFANELKGELYQCINDKLSGDFDVNDWEKATKYTDDSYAIGVESKLEQTAKELKISFTETHNNGYEQGITTINKNGVYVYHSGIGTRTNMSAEGFNIIDNKGELIAQLSAKEQWTQLKVDKVFAENIENIYKGEDNLYVNHAYSGDSEGSNSKPFSSFSDLNRYLSLTPIINKTLNINILSEGDITETFILNNLHGNGTLNITLANKGIYQGEKTREAGIKFSNVNLKINIVSACLFNDFLHGALFYNCGFTTITNLIFNVPNYGILFTNTNANINTIDFVDSYCPVCADKNSIVHVYSCAGNGKGECFRVMNGGIIIYGKETVTAIPYGSIVNKGGFTHQAGDITKNYSWKYPTNSIIPQPQTTNTYVKTFDWTSHKTYAYQWSNWSDDDCKQGSWGYGLRGGHMFFDIAAIRSFLSGTVEEGNTITLTRANSGGNYGPSKVYINGSNCSSANGTPIYSNQTLLGTLSRAETKTFTLPKTIVDSLKTGVCSSLAVYVNDTASDCYLNIVNASLSLKVKK